MDDRNEADRIPRRGLMDPRTSPSPRTERTIMPGLVRSTQPIGQVAVTPGLTRSQVAAS
jgi:hypothetical protein